jgi:hypothetical protein
MALYRFWSREQQFSSLDHPHFPNLACAVVTRRRPALLVSSRMARSVRLPAQKFAAAVCAGVRSVESFPPTLRTSSKSLA